MKKLYMLTALAVLAFAPLTTSTVANAGQHCNTNWVNGACGTPPVATGGFARDAASGVARCHKPNGDSCRNCGSTKKT